LERILKYIFERMPKDMLERILKDILEKSNKYMKIFKDI